jgi:hypothetical protein
MSLCFMEAFKEKRKGNITEEEYIHHLLSHCKGVTHDEDEKITGVYVELSDKDPFGYSLRCWALDMMLNDITPIENVFTAYRTGDVDEVQASMARLSDEHATLVRKSLSMLALQDRRAGVLKLCLDQGGFAYEHYFEDAANQVSESEDPETFEVLENSRFRQIYPRNIRRSRRTKKPQATHSPGLEETAGNTEASSKPQSPKGKKAAKEAKRKKSSPKRKAKNAGAKGEDDDGDNEEEEEKMENLSDEDFRTRAAAIFDVGGKLPVYW